MITMSCKSVLDALFHFKRRTKSHIYTQNRRKQRRKRRIGQVILFASMIVNTMHMVQIYVNIYKYKFLCSIPTVYSFFLMGKQFEDTLQQF